MARYGISQRLIRSFKKLIALEPAAIPILSSVIESAKIGDGVTAIAEENINKFSSYSIGEEDLKEIVQALFSIVNVFVESKEPIDKFINDFTTSYKDSQENIDNASLEKLHSILAELIPQFKPIKQTIKARILSSENPKNFTEGRIISDIRIVYDDDDGLTKKEQYAVVVHHLKLEYFMHDRPNSIYISLDLEDLYKLEDVIKRAIQKDELIRTKNHDLSFINLK